ncbi:uncharacterized protein [Dysidea avara]|uniref:uncharacterized protein n=1 Tax=Dysidea avara TaxID=196820 RepID=UPI003316B11B
MSSEQRRIKRVQSATARLTSADNPAPPTKERSLSAREAKELTKEIQESSAEIKKVFPRTGGVWRSYSWGRTSYNSDFGPKPEVERTKVRPSSRTRLNNPHPNQSFLQWRIPVRLHGNKKVVAPSKATVMDAKESFYDDYFDHTRNLGGLHQDVVTNVAKIPFPGNSTLHDDRHFDMGVAGMKLQLNTRGMADRAYGDAEATPTRPMSANHKQQSRVVNHTVKEGYVPVFKEWLDTANTEEKQIVLDMLKAGNNKEMRIQRAAEEVLQPEVLPNVQEWLTKTSEKDQQMLVNILETLAMVNSKQQAAEGATSRSRSLTFPPNKPQFQWASPSYPQKLQQYSRYLPAQPKPRPRSATSHHSIEKQRPASAITLWNHKLDRDPVCNVFHPGSMFNLPHKKRGKHFAIHPEWPIA